MDGATGIVTAGTKEGNKTLLLTMMNILEKIKNLANTSHDVQVISGNRISRNPKVRYDIKEANKELKEEHSG